jgi:hypothetical protein
MHLGNYLGLLDNSEQQLAEALRTVATHHGDEPDILQTCRLLAGWSEQHRQQLEPLIARYKEKKDQEPDKLKSDLFAGPRKGSLALLRDLHDLWLLANEVKLSWTVLLQAAYALRDEELKSACIELGKQTDRQIAWLQTRIKQAAPQALVVA